MPGRSTQSLAVMNRAIVVIVSLFLLLTAEAKERASPEQIDEWATYYYLDPRPEDVAAALQTVSKQGLFENDGAQAPLSGFFAEVFRGNPSRITEWVKPYVGVPGRHILYSALWMANSKEAKSALEVLARGAGAEEAKQLRALISSTPPTMESMKIDSPAALDYLWGSFMATGSEVPVIRIIDQIKRVNAKGNVGEMLIGGAAQWSVSANARQHKKVLQIVKARAASADAETKGLLQEIISGAEGDKKANDR